MPEKTYTLTELLTNLRERVDGEKHTLEQRDAVGEVIAAMLGYDLTDEGYEQFDRDLTALGL